MKLLLLGGTVFLGRQLVEVALARGHSVTVFNRGRTNPELFPEAEKLRGDRSSGDLAALTGRNWDAVLDTSGYVPRVVGASAERLAERVAHYTFISTESVYADFRTPGLNESYPVGQLADESTEEVTGETYGPLKALCERAVEAALPGRSLIVRPGLIVGPHDPTDRFTYWPARAARGGEVLAPGRSASPVQFIDVRDLAAWAINLVEKHETGIFNADGPPHTLGELLETSRVASGSDARLTWVNEEFLAQHNVAPWSELPLWVPESDPDLAGFASISIEKALRAGLTHRPLADTVRDTLAWAATRPADHHWRAGLTPEREAELLEHWKKQP